MKELEASINRLILKPEYKNVLTLVKAFRNGAVYGAKVRFPHALVMIFLFRSGRLRENLGLILKATRQHARNLATFAFLYKLLLMALRSAPQRLRQSEKEASYDTFLAGLVGGYIVFGRGIQSSVNQQIVIYVFGRVVLALAKLAIRQESLVPKRAGEWLQPRAWPIFASLSWAAVMWLFRWYPESLQPSLRSSMQYIYENADHWDNFRNLIIHNS